MGKISDIQLRAQAVILAKEGYSCQLQNLYNNILNIFNFLK